LNCLGQTQQAKKDSSIIKNDSKIVLVEEIMAKFGDNEADLQNYIVKTSKFPIQKNKTASTKIVVVQFLVTKEGKVSNAKIVKGYDKAHDEEAIRIIMSMPNWKAGQSLDGKNMDQWLTLQVMFE